MVASPMFLAKCAWMHIDCRFKEESRSGFWMENVRTFEEFSKNFYTRK